MKNFINFLFNSFFKRLDTWEKFHLRDFQRIMRKKDFNARLK